MRYRMNHLIIFGSDTITFALQIIKYSAPHALNHV